MNWFNKNTLLNYLKSRPLFDVRLLYVLFFCAGPIYLFIYEYGYLQEQDLFLLGLAVIVTSEILFYFAWLFKRKSKEK